MILELENGDRVELRFTHYRRKNQTTTAQVRGGCCSPGEKLIGMSFCNPSDNFSKAIGRKVALKQALVSVPRDLRRQIWKAYFEAVNNAGK